jgi:hypothetical protein
VKKESNVHLPFETDDFKVSEVISKILMLRDDDKIKDMSIQMQIEKKKG